MIDTVVLRLHDLRKYDLLVKRLHQRRNKGFKIKTASVETKELNRIRNSGNDFTRQNLNIMEINRTGEFLIKTEVKKQVNVSHHYAFTYRIDYTRDFIEFNFSVPKYKYGSNVIMFVEHLGDVDFKMTTNWTLKYNINKTPGDLRSFIKNFFKREFTNDNIDLHDLEVNRVDVCFNQVFKSKDDALLYLNYQKKLKKKHSRDEEGVQTNYNTSLMYKTARSSCKIYHKGTEYKKHDLREHLKINDEKGVQYFITKRFQEFADRMLRYEVTIRSAEMNYLFKHNIFRRDCPFFKIDYKNYSRIANTKKRNDRISKTIGSLPDNEKEAYRKYHPYEKISKEDRSTYEYVSNLIEKKPKFMMEIDSLDERYNLETVNYDSGNALFSRRLIWLCLKKLVGFINEYKIQELPNEERVSLLIDEYNLKHKPKFQKSDMIQFYHLLVKYGSFKEAAKFSRFSRATLYRYKDRFKKIGITERNVHPDQSYSIAQAPTDLKEYHSYLVYKVNLLRGLKIR